MGTQSPLSPQRYGWWPCFAGFAAFAFLVNVVAQTRPRARDLGISPGVHATGALNAITDVEGVRVGHTTIVEGDRVRTGVTAIVPHGGNVFQDKVAGAVFVGNAFREARRIDAGERARHDRNADRPDQHAEHRHRDGRRGPLHAGAGGQRTGAIGERGGRRNQRRRP